LDQLTIFVSPFVQETLILLALNTTYLAYGNSLSNAAKFYTMAKMILEKFAENIRNNVRQLRYFILRLHDMKRVCVRVCVKQWFLIYAYM